MLNNNQINMDEQPKGDSFAFKYAIIPVSHDEANQAFIAHYKIRAKLWNELRNARLSYLNGVNTILRRDSEAANLLDDELELTNIINDLYDQRAKARQRVRNKKDADTSSIEESINVRSEERRAIWDQLKPVRQRIFKTPEFKDQFKQLRTEYVKAKKYAVNNFPAHWQVKGEVLESFTASENKIFTTNRVMREKKDHDHSYTSVLFQVQQRGATVNTLIDGKAVSGGSLNGIKLIPIPNKVRRNGKKTYALLSLPVYLGKSSNDRIDITFEVILHRPLPLTANIKYIRVTRNRVRYNGAANDYEWSVIFTVRDQRPSFPNISKESCGINFGWKKVKDGIRVATIFNADGTHEFINIPYNDTNSRNDNTLSRFRYITKIQSGLDKLRDDAKAVLKELLGMPGMEFSDDDDFGCLMNWLKMKLRYSKEPDNIMCLCARVARTHGFYDHATRNWDFKLDEEKLNSLSDFKTYPKNKEAFLTAMIELTNWYFGDQHLENSKYERGHKVMSDMLRNFRSKITNWRNEFYTLKAIELTKKYGMIVLDGVNLAEMAKKQKSNGEERSTDAGLENLRANVAISIFIKKLRDQGAKNNCKVYPELGKIANSDTPKVNLPFSKYHDKCQTLGVVLTDDQLIAKCETCGDIFDVDVNAARNVYNWHVVGLVDVIAQSLKPIKSKKASKK